MFRAYVMVPILYIRIRLMVTNDPKAMSFLLMNALVCVVMLDITVNICAGTYPSPCCVVDGGSDWTKSYLRHGFN